MPTDPLDLVDPVRLVLLLLPERYRAPVGAAITLAIASQALAASIVSRLPLAAREHPRWGWLVRALGWWSVLRFRDEKGTTKLPGDPTAPRVTVAPVQSLTVAEALARLDEAAKPLPLPPTDAPRETMAAPPPIAPAPLRAVTLPPDASQAQYESARAFVAGAAGFDMSARQEIAPEVVAAAVRLTREGEL